MKRFYRLCMIALVLSFAVSTYGQNSSTTRETLSGLDGVAIDVEPVSNQLEDKGMPAFVFAVEVERRLKAAGVTVLNFENTDPPPGLPTLSLHIVAVIDEVVEQVSYAIRLELTQTVRLERDANFDVIHAPTWSVGGVGVYSDGWRGVMIEDVLAYTDVFIDAYFAANPDARP